FQRLMIAWAMLNHPEVLFFDEPTAGVDAGFEETIYQLVHRVQEERGTTILLISHDLNIVYRYADQVICLNRKLICSGPPAETLSHKQLQNIYGESGFYAHNENRAHHHRK
ncbi:MAG: metal ABC transporter ATP-binding protein, partial [bacterium]|nr:metal ABC transporter ATP-binding protein [bacterium]